MMTDDAFSSSFSKNLFCLLEYYASYPILAPFRMTEYSSGNQLGNHEDDEDGDYFPGDDDD